MSEYSTPYIDATRRPVETLLKTFVDDYQWYKDFIGNHRLVHLPTDQASQWVMDNSIAVLHDKMIVSDYWRNILPIGTLLQWQGVKIKGT